MHVLVITACHSVTWGSGDDFHSGAFGLSVVALCLIMGVTTSVHSEIKGGLKVLLVCVTCKTHCENTLTKFCEVLDIKPGVCFSHFFWFGYFKTRGKWKFTHSLCSLSLLHIRGFVSLWNEGQTFSHTYQIRFLPAGCFQPQHWKLYRQNVAYVSQTCTCGWHVILSLSET